MSLPNQNGASRLPTENVRRKPHAPPQLVTVTEQYFDPESADAPVVPLSLGTSARERLDLVEPPIEPLPDAVHLAQVVENENGVEVIRDKAQRNVTHEKIRSTKRQTATGIKQHVDQRDDELAHELDFAITKRDQFEETKTIKRPRKDDDGEDATLSISQRAWLCIDCLAVTVMLSLEGVVTTSQVLDSYLPAGDHLVTALAIGIPPVLGFFYALRARPLDLKHHELPSFNELLTRRGVQFSVFVIVLFAFLLGENSGTTSVFSSDGNGPSSWKQSLFTCSLMLLLAINAKNTFRLIREQLATLIEFVPVPDLHHKYWSIRIAQLRQTRLANAGIGNEMLVIQERIEEEAEKNADHEEGVFYQHVARVNGARSAGAAQAAQQISQLFSRN